MENLELLNDLRSGNLSNIEPQSRAEEILLAIHEKMDRTVDTSKVTVTADTLLEGVTAHDAEGNPITGTHTDEGFKYAITDFSYFCEDGRRTKDIKTLDTSNGTNFRSMFLGCSSLTSIPALNTSNGMSFMHMFDSCSSLTAIPQLDTSSGTNFSSMFFGCYSITSIPALDTSNGTGFSGMFHKCSSLKDITFTGTINVTGINLSYSPLLTKESITSLVNALSSTATGRIVTVSQTAVNNAFTAEEWNALKATKSNWTIELKDSV